MVRHGVGRHRNAASRGLRNFFEAPAEQLSVRARTCARDSLSAIEHRDLPTSTRAITDPTDFAVAGLDPDH